MNYLAHFHLAWPNPDHIAGGLEGDFRKGLLATGSGDGFIEGIRLHRAIDGFTDSHPIVEELRQSFDAPWRRYAGILIDLSFDHFLTQHWSSFSAVELSAFNRQVYAILSAQSRLSPAARKVAERLQLHDGLAIYNHWDSVAASAAHIGKRFSSANPLHNCGAVLDSRRTDLKHAFLDFYPDLLTFTDTLQESDL